MPRPRFYIADVLAEAPYEGNPLAVVRDSESLSGQDMQRIANEMNYSETAFLLGNTPREGAYDVRIFTPREEVPFAGHPTPGTAYVIARYLPGAPEDELVLDVPAGRIPVTLATGKPEGGALWMLQLPPRFGAATQAAEIAAVLGIDAEDVDTRVPVQEVSTGLPFIIVPLRGLGALQRIAVHRESVLALVRDREAKAILAFCGEGHGAEPALSARVFTDYYGISEDPATGSANGCLAGYLVRTRYLGGPRVEVRVEQGYEIGRPSVLHLRAEEEADAIRVEVGGRVVMVAEGELL